MRTAAEILQSVIIKNKVHSLDPFEVFERMTKAAEIAINESRVECINECAEVAREQGVLGYHEHTGPSIKKLIEQVK